MSNNKKIQSFSTYFYPVSAGLESAIFELYKRLASRGWQINAHTTKMNINNKNLLPSKEQIYDININRYHALAYSIFPFLNKLEFSPGELVCFHDFNIFPDFTIYLKIWWLKMINHKKITVILTEHGSFTRKLLKNSSIKLKLKKIIDHSFGTFIINRVVDKIQAVSIESKERLKNAGIKVSIIVINNGIDSMAFEDIESLASKEIKDKVKSYGKYLVQVGRINPVKNIESSIRCLKNLPKDIILVIAGSDQDPNYKKLLEDLVQKLDLSNRVIFFGPVYGADKYYLMKHSIALTQMSLSEGYSLVVLEAMSQGCICLVSKNTSLEEQIKNNINGFCLDYNDFEQAAKYLEFIIDDKNQTQITEMKKTNIKFASSKSWDEISQKVENLYLESIK